MAAQIKKNNFPNFKIDLLSNNRYLPQTKKYVVYYNIVNINSDDNNNML